ncbi:hypothetical protein [Rugamonas aquatica]|uniref:Uncharacterized protein n=1 Tax=Rugamonas aquatica TaxID=2743357 RepID=A0A6A7N231_9BURK|nr:hypothetical protein [Rugamonas aquatica]MQA39062.1 hypothetical protein [Rugamonas aquatica]
MDRATVYNGEELIETDILNGNKFAMIGLAKLAQAVLGTAPVLQGLACTPGTGLTAAIAAGQVYQMAAVDATPYSSLGVDSRQVLKQGILADPIAVPVPAPGTAGKSINYLVQVQFQEVDTGALVLPFYNASNPAIPYSGPGGLGTSSMTIRSGKCAVQVKAGAMASTGSQVTPTPDAGWIGAYSVQVDYGMTTVPAPNIAPVAGAPFLTLALPQAAPLSQVQNNGLCYAVDAGAANAYAAAYSPAVTVLTDGMVLEFKAANANTGTATFSPDGLAVKAIIGGAHAPLQGGEIVAGGEVELMWHATLNSWVLLGCTGGALQVGAATQSRHAVSLSQVLSLVGGMNSLSYFMGQL